MKIVLSVGFGLCLLAASFVQAKPSYQVVCYSLQNTKSSTTSLTGSGGTINWSSDVPWNDLTVIVDAFYQPNTNKTFTNMGAKGSALVNAAHANGVRCIVSIGGAGQDGAFPTLCTSANRAAFASAVANLVSSNGYDGVDIDWETPNSASQSDATAMMELIYQDIKALPNSSFDNKPRTLSFATVDYIRDIYNMTTLGSYTDWCFYMGYDWYDCPNRYNGPLNLIKSGIAAMTDGSHWSYPIGKMVLGCPLYTNDYDSSCGAVEYPTLSVLHLGTPGSYNTSYAEQAYTANGHTVYVDTAQSYCDKTNWAIGAGLKGIGMWDLGQGLPSTDSLMSPIWNVIGGNSSCLTVGRSVPTATPTRTRTFTPSPTKTNTPAGTATFTPTKTKTPVPPSTWRINAGGPAYTDVQGHGWSADGNFSGGTAAVTNASISNTADPTLYQSERFGACVYSLSVPPGSYQVTLKFAEIYWNTVGQRIFNVVLNGTTVLSNFDILADAGSAFKADDKVFNNVAPNSNGQIVVQLVTGSADLPKISAVQVIPQPSTPTPTHTKTATPTPTKTASVTPADSATSTPTATFTVPASLTATPTQAAANTWRVNAGGPAYTDSLGNSWLVDTDFTGGAAAVRTATVTGTNDSTLYQSYRYGASFSYGFNVPSGNYRVTLKFAENFWTAAGQRVFNVSINGTQVLTNFDIFAAAGGQNIAVDRVFDNITPQGGVITLSFGPASVDTAKVNAIQIVPEPATSTPTRTNTIAAATSTPTAMNTVASPTATRTPTPTHTPAPPTATFTVTPTYSPAPPTNTPTVTSTRTATSTSTATNTPAPPTLTYTPAPPTATFTPTATHTPVPPTPTPTKTSTPSSACSGVPAWNGNSVYYAIGAKVTYNNRLYKCIQAHASQPTWTPPATPALWQDMGPC